MAEPMTADPYELAIAKVMAEQERASCQYPSTLVAGHRLHIFEASDGRWEVWINTDLSDFDGVCVGQGRHRLAALADARLALLAINGFLARQHAQEA